MRCLRLVVALVAVCVAVNVSGVESRSAKKYIIVEADGDDFRFLDEQDSQRTLDEKIHGIKEHKAQLVQALDSKIHKIKGHGSSDEPVWMKETSDSNKNKKKKGSMANEDTDQWQSYLNDAQESYPSTAFSSEEEDEPQKPWPLKPAKRPISFEEQQTSSIPWQLRPMKRPSTNTRIPQQPMIIVLQPIYLSAPPGYFPEVTDTARFSWKVPTFFWPQSQSQRGNVRNSFSPKRRKPFFASGKPQVTRQVWYNTPRHSSLESGEDYSSEEYEESPDYPEESSVEQEVPKYEETIQVERSNGTSSDDSLTNKKNDPLATHYYYPNTRFINPTVLS